MKMIFFSPVELKHRGIAGRRRTLVNSDPTCPTALLEPQMCYKSDRLCID